MVAREAVRENNDLTGLKESMTKLGHEEDHGQEVSEEPQKLFLLNLADKPVERDVKTDSEMVVVPKPEPVSETKSSVSPSRSPSPKGEGFLNWIAGNGFVKRVAEKAKSSVDTMITTLDPGMKAYLCELLGQIRYCD